MLLLLLGSALVLGSCSEGLFRAIPQASASLNVCQPTPVSEFGRVGGDLAARLSSEALPAGAGIKILWAVRGPRAADQLRLSVERMDRPGTGEVTTINRSGPSVIPPPPGWEGAAF